MKKINFKVSVALAAMAIVMQLIFGVQAVSAAGTWQTKAAMPTARAGLSLGAHNGVIYAAGGWNGFHRTTVEAYDTATNTWTGKASMPGPQTHAASGVINGVLYVAGGDGGAVATNTFRAYDIATNSWIAKPSMPTTRMAAAGGVIAGKFYVAGGINANNQPGQPHLATLEVFDPGTNGWSSLASMPTARSFAAGGVVNGVFYVVGGSGPVTDTNTPTTTVQAYNPVTNTWTTKAPMPTARFGHAVAVLNGILYALGGSDSDSVPLSTVEAYNPATNTWSTDASMPTARATLRVEPAGGTLYAIGGGTTAGASGANEAFTPGPPDADEDNDEDEDEDDDDDEDDEDDEEEPDNEEEED